MEYNFREIESKWQKDWKESEIYKVSNDSPKPKYYVLDMFPYPSGAGLHVGHPLGYIASDICARYKRLKGFNVLHPMGFDSFGLPAEQYALETGQHPAITTEKNIATFKSQMDKIGFCYDWSREVKTSDPKYYRWTQWIFLELFKSWYNHKSDKAESIETLIKIFEESGTADNSDVTLSLSKSTTHSFTAEQWKSFDEKKQQEILMDFRLAFSSYGEVNWCEALGTVLANDEVINGVSERGGHPVEKKKMRQWYLRITEYADRLLKGLETVNFSEAMKEMQRNWIGRSEGAEMEFGIAGLSNSAKSFTNNKISPNHDESLIPGISSPNGDQSLTPNPSRRGEGDKPRIFQTSNKKFWPQLKDLSRENRQEKTKAENILWQQLRNMKLDAKVRRQHVIDGFIIDFAFLNEHLLVEVDGGYHNDSNQKEYDQARTKFLTELGFRLIRFTNEEVENNISNVLEKIRKELAVSSPLSSVRGGGGETLQTKQGDAAHSLPVAEASVLNKTIKVYTTRPDTIFGVDFLVLAPEHELVKSITTTDQQSSIDDYLTYVKSRSDRERQAEVKQITGCFTGAYAINPFDGKQIPIWIAEYVLAGYGTGAIMAVPCGDQRDFLFAKHFDISITNIIGEHYNGEEANATKEAVLENSGFLNGMLMKDAISVAIDKIEELGIGKRKVNYRMRDAGFSRQRYWGEPFPIIWSDGVALPLNEKELPLELPFVEKYGPGKEGEGPLSNLTDWVNVSVDADSLHSDLTPDPSPKGRGEEKESFITSDASTWRVLKPFARENRKEQTPAEELLWTNLINRNISNSKFRRQHAIGSFIVDFVCIEKKLVIEVDGDYHLEVEQKKYDQSRTEFLTESGFKELRFSNDGILKNISSVLEKIREYLEVAHSPLLAREPVPIHREVRDEVVHGKRETSTMPGYAGSSWYFLRYMDPHNSDTFADRKATDYWNQVDVYIGGTEHAVGHLLYSRLWTKVLYDLGHLSFEEPYKKLVNQGMITGVSEFIYRYNPDRNPDSKFMSDVIPYFNINVGNLLSESTSAEMMMAKGEGEIYFSYDAIPIGEENNFSPLRVLIGYVDSNKLDVHSLTIKDNKYSKAFFVTKEGGFFFKEKWYNKQKELSDNQVFVTTSTGEKMSKSKLNAINPDSLVDKYGADTFRMYEMFLGPLEQSKPWDTKGIEGVHRFLKKLWRLFYDDSSSLSRERGAGGEAVWNEEKASDAELKTLHKSIKKIEEDTERFSYNTAVSAFMVCVNELTELKCHKKEVLEPLLILLTPYAPHIAEELYHVLGNTDSVLNAQYPKLENKYLTESEKEYPISLNGKLRTTMTISLSATQAEVEELVLSNEIVQKWMEGKTAKKIIYVKNKMVNIVV